MTKELQLHHISVSDMDNNCYLLSSDGEGLLIDAAADAPALLQLAKDAGVTITKVLTTHRHWDHTQALSEVIAATGAKHYASFLDAPALPAPVDVELHNGDVIEHAGVKLDIIILRGHTPGGVAVATNIAGHPAIFSGDSLFPGGVGKTSCEADFARLFNDVTSRIFDKYPDNTVVYPGHGAKTTLGTERPQLPEWEKRRW
ncbi:MBL fold metallo-hydrolase [Corynebacterium caspium]|uniref:MBL fold metallo-hydrolase n=1 Tax=Corynebacterium caspium TaxID=234828 RepID=UPI000361EED7|nr:MBL fold metallo-hydrolase [Corynebacterium caspium]